MRVYGKEWNYNVYACEYCLYWKGEQTGCTLESCCCEVVQKPKMRNGQRIYYPTTAKTAPQSGATACEHCPYGRDFPCLGYCTKNAMTTSKLWKEPQQNV